MDLPALAAGLVAFAISVILAVVLVFVTYRINTVITAAIDNDALLIAGNRSVGIALGATVFSQAYLMRHAVFPTMVLVRDLFLRPSSFGGVVWVVLYSALSFVVVSLVSIAAVAIASWLFQRMTRIPETEEIRRDNVAVGIFFGFVLIGITLILNEGVEDLSRSIIPYPESGVVRLPER